MDEIIISDIEVIDGEVVNEGHEGETWNINPCQCDGEVAQDYQGAVPCWDGYDG